MVGSNVMAEHPVQPTMAMSQKPLSRGVQIVRPKPKYAAQNGNTQSVAKPV